METLAIILVIAACAGFVAFAYKRRRDTSFEGVVTNKTTREIRSDNRNDAISFNSSSITYFLKVHTSTGKDIDWDVKEDIYATTRVGDRVTKLKGTTNLIVTPQVAVNQAVQQPPIQDSVQPIQGPPTQTPPTV